MEHDRFLEHERLRAEAFRLLAELYHLPDGELAEKVKDLWFLISVFCPEGAKHVRKMDHELEKLASPEESLILDYSRLFLGPYRVLAPPYGSVYLDGERRVMGDSTLAVAGVYRDAGLDVSDDFNDPPDHIAAELEFMYYLVFMEMRAIARRDFRDAGGWLRKQKEFLREHLGAWVGQFASKVGENARSGFYRDLAAATMLFVAQDLGELSGLPFTESLPQQEVKEVVSC